jgi:hypothetical protein
MPMDDTNEILNAADWLADFSNLEPAGVEDFQKKHAGFVPEFWWTESVSGLTGATVKIWQVSQAYLQEAWKSGPGKRAFPLTACIRLISAGVLRELPTEGRDYHAEQREQSAIYHINRESDLLQAGTRVWPYQQAVMFLGTNPWRALFCGLCGKRFAADKPGRRFCSEDCTREARKRGQLAWWSTNGNDWRNGKTKQKESRKSAKKIRKTKKENA